MVIFKILITLNSFRLDDQLIYEVIFTAPFKLTPIQ